MTKKRLKQIFKRFCINHAKYGCRGIFQAYKKPSDNKILAWTDCIDFAYEYEGKGTSVVSSNMYRFNVGFYYKDKDTSDYIFVYITPSNWYKYKLECDDVKLLKETFHGNI